MNELSLLLWHACALNFSLEKTILLRLAPKAEPKTINSLFLKRCEVLSYKSGDETPCFFPSCCTGVLTSPYTICRRPYLYPSIYI